ncbi:hypothetical protein G7081_04485 [Vagococcus coleopterorum]|uniref:Uncharacterized protein n=1 Tax=Vagococcus coleopterorum TaxID=2714946 RepID=A0A6G8AMR7_9ENTE|nr:SPJ_0845 family protein [Vagococcus coleopterorum]QIL46374.1 hypothetical protein G7081_04485 [Vagococcus coleopterorum]
MGLKFKKDDFLEKKFEDFGLDSLLSDVDQRANEAKLAAEKFIEKEQEQLAKKKDEKKGQ